VGDSHTYGGGVPTEESYPAELQKFLDGRTPNTWSVINLGVPGMNTAQLRRRLPDYVSLYGPEVVVVWAGVNNSWNLAEVDMKDSGWRVRMDAFAIRSRLYRLVRVRLHDLRLERDVVLGDANNAPRIPPDLPNPLFEETPIRLRRGGRVEHIQHVKGPMRVDRVMEERVREDFEAMARYARVTGIRMFLITYPRHHGAFAVANLAVFAAARRYHIPVIVASRSAQRVPEHQRVYLLAEHPSGPIYREVARDVADLLLPAPPWKSPAREAR